MYIAYFDETGDDGLQNTSTKLFVLTSVLINEKDWKESYYKYKNLRKELKTKYDIPVKWELHTKKLITNKKPYNKINLSSQNIIEIIELYIKYITSLDIKVVNVIIDKTKIKTNEYPILENALKYNLQRVDNYIRSQESIERYLIISDEGRIGTMRKTARRLQVNNPIPSHYGKPQNVPLELMIEDILSKDSRESHLIQISDFISCLVDMQIKYYKKIKWHNRIVDNITINVIDNWIEKLKSIYMLQANKSSRLGYVIYPKT